MEPTDNALSCHKTNFDALLRETKKMVDPGCDLIKKRATAVTGFIREVLKVVEETTPHLKVSEILPVGSSYEGTKILEANEYDFLIVIDELSRPGAVTVETDDTCFAGTVKLKLSREANEDGKWDLFIRDGYLRCFETVFQQSLEDSFGYRVIEAISKLGKIKGRKSFRQNNEIEFYRDSQTYANSRGQNVLIERADVKHPNILLEFKCDGQTITTDLCPAIRYLHPEICFNPEFCYNQRLVDEVLGKKSILMVSRENQLFRITYTETEVDFLKNKMQTRHKDLYIFLKVIAHYFNDVWNPLPSYALKTICVKHDLSCLNASENSLLCFNEILEVILTSLCDMDLPNAFDHRVNIFNNQTYPTPQYRRNVVAPVLRQIRELCKKTHLISASVFHAEIKDLVRSANDGFDPLTRRGVQ